MRLRVSLFTKILLWFFLDLAVLAAVFVVFFRLQFQLSPDSLLYAGNRLDAVFGQIVDELRAAPEADRTGILKRYAASSRVEFLLFENNGEQIAGPATKVPAEVARYLRGFGPAFEPSVPPPVPGGRGGEMREPPRDEGDRPPDRHRKGIGPWRGPAWPLFGGPRWWRPRPGTPFAQPTFMLSTANPTRHWAGRRVPLFEPSERRPQLATLVAVSDSPSGHGLFFDITPWLIVGATVVGLSILLWLPFVHDLTGTIRQMTGATEQIANQRFDTRVNEKRSDELGRLGAAINQLSARLAAFVGGQRRFLGDISHELNTPLARMQLALGILEERVDASQQGYVTDVREEVQLMSKLVAELLAFSRTGMKAQAVELAVVPLAELARKVAAREAAGCEVAIRIPDDEAVMAQPELLLRALANVVRNAGRYAGHAGPVTIATERQGKHVVLTVADRGPGVPPDSVARLFEPFFRPEADRARATGGTGLGLAIVKTCVEACGGTVSARNLAPAGFEVSMVLRAADVR